jgi:hypothetical protein
LSIGRFVRLKHKAQKEGSQMKLPINKTVVVGLCVLLAVSIAGAVLLTAFGVLGTHDQQPTVGLSEGMPLALNRHIEKLMQTVPGNGGEPGEGPGLTDFAFQQRAYPDDSIPLERIEAAQAAAVALQRRGFPTGKGQPGTFVSVGPLPQDPVPVVL